MPAARFEWQRWIKLVVVVLLVSAGLRVARAVECGAKAVGDTPFTVCRVDLKAEQLELFWRDEAGRPFRQFSALRD
ncbi:MAG TPA: hypothetical protein VK731_11470, partial [Candidatus Cybelea sp.]|nr:hypothetical protein [Candidatus Cybelea sp.]